MKHILAALFSAILFIAGIYALYKPLGRELIPQIAPFFIGEQGIWGTIKMSSEPEAKEVEYETLSDKVKIMRDEFGIPHIYAETYEDALFGLGYITGRDRMFQMELFNRFVAGETSDWFGPSYVEVDKFMLQLGLDKTAWDMITKTYSTEEYDLLKKYSEGVNFYINNEFDKIPPFEYALLGIPSRYHRPVDGIRSLMWYHFLMNWNMNDFYVQQIVDKIGPDSFIDLFYHNLVHVSSPDGSALPKAQRPKNVQKLDVPYKNVFELLSKQKDQFEQLSGWKSSSITSNTVALKTEKNKILLSFDVHSPLVQPGLFYEVYMHLGKKTIHGFTMPGIPGILFGSNGDVNWTHNSTPIDVVDFNISTDSVEIIKENNYVINVREGNNVSQTVKTTRNGILINSGSEFIEMKWSAYQGGGVCTALKNSLFAKNINELYESYKDVNLPVLEIVAADKKGVGYFLSGQIPKRDAFLGIQEYKKDAHSTELEPSVLYAYPASNKVVYANQYPVKESNSSFPYFTEQGFWRTNRLLSLVNRLNETAGINDLENILQDKVMQEIMLKPIFSTLFRGKINNPVTSLGNQLRAWDFNADRDATFPKFFINLEKVTQNLTFDEFPNRFFPDQDLVYELMLNEPDNPIFDIKSTPLRENAIQILNMAFSQAYELSVLESGTPENWTWSNANRAVIKHVSNNHILNQLSDLIVSREGFGNTVLKSKDGVFPVSSTLKFSSSFEKGELSTRAIMFSGNSGNRYSPFFENQLQHWSVSNLRPNWKYEPSDSLKKNGYLIITNGK